MRGWISRHFIWATLLVVAVVVTFDQAMKAGVRSGSFAYSSTWIEIAPHFNEGILGGVFSDLHPWIIRIFFSVLFGFIALLTSLLLHFIRHKEVWRLKFGIVLYVAGILGNVLDRAIWGQITDFLILNLPLFRGYALNFADFSLISGLILMIYSFVRDSRRIWFDQNQRRSVIIESRFQYGFATFLAFMAGMNALIVGLYSFTFLKVYLEGDVVVPARGDLIRDYLLGLGVIEIGFLLIAFGTGLIFSHRMAGPIYAFEKYVERLLIQSDAPKIDSFRLRNMDYFKSLEKTAQLIQDRFKKFRN